MEWFISHQSALEFWRQAQAKDIRDAKRLRVKGPPAKPLDARELYTKNPWGLSMPVSVLVGSNNACKATRGLECYIGSGPFPVGSFLAISGLTVSSPELCIMQMASILSFTDLVKLGYEFCGTYRLDKESEAIRGFRDDKPLTSVAKLDSYIAMASGLKGCKKARKALRYITENSASPMETALAMMLSLPYRLGGYGFPLPLLNCRISVTTDTKKKAETRRCDLYWPDAQVDIEYDSDAYHVGSDRISKDAIRRNVLASVGVTVVTVSRMQILKTAELRQVAKVLSKLLDKRLQCPEGFSSCHALLRQKVLPKVSDNR